MWTGPQIFELFGYPVDVWTPEAEANLQKCNCPFMCTECDGGGNRFSSAISLSDGHPLRSVFPNRASVQSGVCSIQLHEGESPWIVCPRRLLNYRSGAEYNHQDDLKQVLCDKSGLVRGERYSVWSEVKMKCSVRKGGKIGHFDYTFDYVIAGRERRRISDVSDMLGKSERTTLGILAESGFTTCFRAGEMYCDDFPSLPLVIVEVMTSSTCGGNKRERTQIAQVFEDTVLKLHGNRTNPVGPGINYRQVWARMVSQLLVKSQIGVAWGGVTFWVLQDLLAKYISETTALNFSDFLARHKDEVNVIAGGYGDEFLKEKRKGSLVGIRDIKFYAGKVAIPGDGGKTFSDIIKLGCTPPREELLKRLLLKPPCAAFVF